MKTTPALNAFFRPALIAVALAVALPAAQAAKTKLEKNHTFCTCSIPNFRNASEWNKPIKRISKLVLPKSPYGETTHYLCEDCIKKIYGGIKDE